uniref:Uncharacterized protein n=1 Tax=Cercocebus atys TaxID=9531 RepID=A0A2K5KL46_CERAT
MGGVPSAEAKGGEQPSWSWRDGEGFQLICRSCPCGPQPSGPAMDVAPAHSPARPPARPHSTCRPV